MVNGTIRTPRPFRRRDLPLSGLAAALEEPPHHQVDEDRLAALVELHDLAVEHDVVGVRFQGDLVTGIIEAPSLTRNE